MKPAKAIAPRRTSFTGPAAKGKAREYADKRAALGYEVKGIIVTADGYAVVWSNRRSTTGVEQQRPDPGKGGGLHRVYRQEKDPTCVLCDAGEEHEH